jgi:BirA family biotin operon repressor/biotin-[acetyl-CoA-carboxylase] ligase
MGSPPPEGADPSPPIFPEGLPVFEKEVTGSTNADALELARHARAPLSLVWARRQTSGRGRLGRAWVSPEGNLFWTMLVSLEHDARPVTGLVFVASLAAWSTIRAFVPPERRVEIKWPNDTLVEGRKVSGILIETAAGAHGRFAAVGIGVNVTHHPPGDMLYPASSLGAEGSGAHRNEVLTRLTGEFVRTLELWRTEGFAGLREQYLRAAFRLGETISVTTGAGSGEVVTGRFVDVEETGLILRLADGSRSVIAAGDVISEPPAAA